ncbi:hypothetical protein ACFLQV_01270, partial [Calditrichota bacterium]
QDWEPRIKQIARPVLRIIPRERYEQLSIIFKRANDNFAILRHTTIQAEIIKAYVQNGASQVPINEIQKQLDEEYAGRYTNRALSNMAKNMGFDTVRLSGGMALVTSHSVLKRLMAQYKIEPQQGQQETMEVDDETKDN